MLFPLEFSRNIEEFKFWDIALVRILHYGYVNFTMLLQAMTLLHETGNSHDHKFPMLGKVIQLESFHWFFLLIFAATITNLNHSLLVSNITNETWTDQYKIKPDSMNLANKNYSIKGKDQIVCIFLIYLSFQLDIAPRVFCIDDSYYYVSSALKRSETFVLGAIPSVFYYNVIVNLCIIIIIHVLSYMDSNILS